MYVSVTKMHAAPQGPRQPQPSVPGPCVVAAVVRAARSAVACTPVQPWGVGPVHGIRLFSGEAAVGDVTPNVCRVVKSVAGRRLAGRNRQHAA